MQETLELTNKLKVNGPPNAKESANKLKVPDINTGMLNSSADFICKLNQFNQRYQADIHVQNSGRWQQGTYDKFKALATNALNPRMAKARSIANIFQLYSYDFNNLKNELLKLDKDLKDIRTSGIKFNDDNDSEGKERLESLISNLQKATINHPDFHIEISRIPWFHRQERKASRPIFNSDNELKGYNGDLEKAEDVFVNPVNDSPTNVYLNVAIPLNDINVNIYHQRAKDDLLYQYEYGNLIVCQSISIFDAILINRRIENQAVRNLTIESYFKGTTYQHPLYSALEHPFVSRSSSIYDAYGTGNTCFGDLTNQILSSIASGDLSRTKLMLDIWASTYPKNNVNPLNRYDCSIFGGPLNFKKGHEDDSISSNPERCKRQVDEYPDEINQQDFIETFCSNCRFIKTCGVYKDWTYVERTLTIEERFALTEFGTDIFKSDGFLQAFWHDDKQEFQNMVESSYLYFARKFEQFSNYEVLFRKLQIRHKGRGKFLEDGQWIDLINELDNEVELSVSDFIKWYYIAEEIWYSHFANEEGFVLEGSPESTPEARRTSIRRARNVHINLQQRQGARGDTISTYAKSVFR